MSRMEPSHFALGATWTDERKATAKRLWLEGHSASEIATALGGTSRNAVIGMITRAGLKRPPAARDVSLSIGGSIGRRTQQTQRPRPVRIEPNPTPQARVFGETKVPLPAPRLAISGNGAVFEQAPTVQQAALKSDAWTPLPGSSPVLLTDRLAFQCKWPVDVPGEDIPRSCGCPAPGAKYCSEHTKRAFQPANSRATATDLYRKYRRVA